MTDPAYPSDVVFVPDVAVGRSFYALLRYCEREDFRGFDPYDGLTSPLLKSFPLLYRSRLIRLAWIQFFKRSPINLRGLTGIRKTYNAKALGLFLTSYCRLYQQDGDQSHLAKIRALTNQILDVSIKGYSGACWGYNFDWESRAFFQPGDTPTVVVTSFVACALLDAYEVLEEPLLLTTARSACDFVLKDLNRTVDDQTNFCFSYSPRDRAVVYNASLLGSKLLSRVYAHTREPLLKAEAARSVAFCCDRQQASGAWSYGAQPFHRWVDNFHTGFNLECLQVFMRCCDDDRYRSHLEKGLDYYLRSFFTPEGVPKYYDDAVYPIDIHAPAQLVITLACLGKTKEYRELIDRVLHWTIEHMQDPRGYFYYQINKYFTSRIPYMRWSQAWMFLALSTYLTLDENLDRFY